ncbi:MAG TPA: hypothetical protein VG963_30535, partial [Polyangiaceae bacterium]|nr:hypothetical protein [Polyangiaceae bacterium]
MNMNRTAPIPGHWRTRAGRQWLWLALTVAVFGAAGASLRAFSGSGSRETPSGDPAGGEPASAAVPAAAGAGGSGAEQDVKAPAAANAPAPNVRILFKTVPSRIRSTVSWGSKRLGFIDRNRPLAVLRPRDSGPLDVIVRSEGFIPVHTRAYTFDDSVIEVKLTPVE